MPEICRFLGIVISMYFDEHNPPHFHQEELLVMWETRDFHKIAPLV